MPFTREQFFQVFAEYNEAIWPMQAVLFLLAILILAAVLARRNVAMVLLAALWAWCGVVYHWMHFATVNRAAWLFGALFLIAALLLLGKASTFEFGDAPFLRVAMGASLIAYALLLYPATGYLAGHLYPETATFGAPCPLTIFTLGLLLLAKPPLPVAIVAVPLLWSAIGTTALFRFGMVEDAGLPLAGIACLAFLLGDRIAHPASEPSHAQA